MYAIILANNTNWVPRQLLGCGKAKLGPLRRRNLHHLMFITPLLLVLFLGHINPHITDCVTKLVVREFELTTWWLECEVLTYWAIRNTLYYMWQGGRGMGRGFPRTCKRGRFISKEHWPLTVVFTHPKCLSLYISLVCLHFSISRFTPTVVI